MQLHDTPCLMHRDIVGDCSLLDPGTVGYGGWGTGSSGGLNTRVRMCPLGRGMPIYLFLFLNPLLHLGAINHSLVRRNNLNVLQ